jgi:antitoxin (DNA-binding transcriptional repressor) of toxin-antitoxin stability system
LLTEVYFPKDKRARAMQECARIELSKESLMETKWIDVKKENVPLQKLLELVASGLDVVLAEGKSPVVRLVPVSQKAKKPRVLGLHAGKIWMSPDFDDPLPDSFWLGQGVL